MTVASVDPAVLAACQAVRDKLFDYARAEPRFGLQSASADALRLEDGAIVGAGGRVGLAELLGSKSTTFVEAEGSAKAGEEHERYAMHALGAQFAEVGFDPQIGQLRGQPVRWRVRRRAGDECQDRPKPVDRRHRLWTRHGPPRGNPGERRDRADRQRQCR
jgi:hypothetical protein